MSTWRLVVIGVLAACGSPEGDAGVTVTPIDGLATTESGGTALFTVVLDRYPNAPVTIPIESSGAGEGTSEPASLTFTSANWDLPQTVTVRGLDDDAADGDVAYTVMTLPATSGDGSFAGVDADDVSLVNRDDDVAGFIITPTAGLTTSENGTDTEFSIRLSTRPDADVTLDVTSSRTDEGTVAPGSLTFTADSWDQPQTITISGVDDVMADGIRNYAIMTQPASSADPHYNGLDPADISVANLDNDTPGITVTPTTGLATSESGDSDTFTIVLDSKPRANVTINLSSSDPGEGTVLPAQLVFSPTNWHLEQTVTVTGEDDSPAIDDGEQPYAIVTAAAISTDANYNGHNPDDVAVANDDDDVSMVVVEHRNLVTSEAGGTDTFVILITAKPTGDVTIPVSTSNADEGTASTTQLTFTPGTWNMAQIVTVTGADDDRDDDDQTFEIILGTATGGGYNFDPDDVPVTNRDDDTAGFVIAISPVGCGTGNATILETSETGGNDCFSIRLASEPSDDVTIDVSSSDTTEGTVAPASLTFTSANWGTPQFVTATGVDDLLLDGDRPYTIVLDAATSNDTDYDGLDPDDVSAINADHIL